MLSSETNTLVASIASCHSQPAPVWLICLSSKPSIKYYSTKYKLHRRMIHVAPARLQGGNEPLVPATT